MSLNRTQKEHLRFLCADAMNSIDWGEELIEAQIPDTPQVWAYLAGIEQRLQKAMGYPSSLPPKHL